jgi:hypothetical protein
VCIDHNRNSFLFVLVFALFTPRCSDAAEPLGPMPITQAVGKSGPILVTLNEHSSLSTPEVMIQRHVVKPTKGEKISTDYDMATEIFYAYIPSGPAADGKYGVMVSTSVTAHQYPPASWIPVLEKHHLIWMGACVVEEPKYPPAVHTAMLLDAAAAVSKLWPVDSLRTYIEINLAEELPGGTPLYFPDVFSGSIYWGYGGWFEKLPDIKNPRLIWPSGNWPHPASAQLQLATQISRVFISYSDDGTEQDFADVLIRRGYHASGISMAADLKVPADLMRDYTQQDGAWFEQGVQYLDAPLDKLRATTRSSGSGGALTAAEPEATTMPAVSPSKDSDDVRAARALVMAKNYVDSQLYDSARTRLRDIISRYPNTSAAKEATQLLVDIEGK